MSRDDPKRELFARAFRPPGARPHGPSQPFDAQQLLEGFELVDERQMPVDPDSPLGRAMAEAQRTWAVPGYVPLDT